MDRIFVDRMDLGLSYAGTRLNQALATRQGERDLHSSGGYKPLIRFVCNFPIHSSTWHIFAP